MACGLTLSELLNLIGHDGSEIVFPELDDPFRRRAFNGQEIVRVLTSLGFVVSEHQLFPISVVDEEHIFALESEKETLDAYMEVLLSRGPGVLCGVTKNTGKYHAVTWNGVDACLDPVGFIYPIDRYEPEVFYTIDYVEGSKAQTLFWNRKVEQSSEPLDWGTPPTTSQARTFS